MINQDSFNYIKTFNVIIKHSRLNPEITILKQVVKKWNAETNVKS